MKYVVLVIALVIIVDAILRVSVLKDHTRFDLVRSDKLGSRTLLVYLPGILADGKQSSLLMVDTWKQYGDVLLVSYDGKRFKPRATAMEVKGLVSKMDYDTVVYIGSSMGGPLAYDIEMLPGDAARTVKFILLASPTGNQYFKPHNDKASLAMWGWWAGPLSNWTGGKLFLKALFQKPKEENIEPAVDTDELKQRVKEAQASPFSVYADQIRYMIGHDGLTPGSLTGFKGVYIRCLRDDIVAPEAYEPWKAAFGGNLPLIESDTTHVGYNEMPNAFKRTFERAFRLIGVSKLS